MEELTALVDEYNGDVAQLLVEARQAFTETVRTDSIVEMQPYRDESTGQVHLTSGMALGLRRITVRHVRGLTLKQRVRVPDGVQVRPGQAPATGA